MPPELVVGSYPGLSMEDYLGLPAVSASLIKCMIERCPAAARFDSWLNPDRIRDTSAAMDAGTIAHAILLEGREDCCAVFDPSEYANATGGGVATGWSNKAIKTARDAARADGKIPVLLDDMASIRGMVDSARRFIDSLRTTEPAIWRAFQPDGGESELTCVWQDGPTLCRMRPDRISTDRRVIIDAKFTGTSAEPDAWSRTQLVRMGYYMSAAFYRRGVKALFGIEDADYVFLVVESEPPYLCSLVGIDPAGFAHGAERVAAGLRDWNRCVQRNEWPAYPPRVAYAELPGYLAAQWEEQQLNAAAGGNWRVLFPDLAEKVEQ